MTRSGWFTVCCYMIRFVIPISLLTLSPSETSTVSYLFYLQIISQLITTPINSFLTYLTLLHGTFLGPPLIHLSFSISDLCPHTVQVPCLLRLLSSMSQNVFREIHTVGTFTKVILDCTKSYKNFLVRPTTHLLCYPIPLLLCVFLVNPVMNSTHYYYYMT